MTMSIARLAEYAPRKPLRCNMDVLLAAVEALRRAEVAEYHARAGKIQKAHVKRKRGVFKCDKCPSVFGLRHNLLRHDRTIHQGRRPFKCGVTSCTASFVQRFDLETHRSSVHDKRKDYTCAECGRGFSQRSNLQTHVKLTHPSPPAAAGDASTEAQDPAAAAAAQGAAPACTE